MTGLNVNWEQIGEILVLLFVISVVFETALTPIFNWRVFARFCEGKGVKTPITVIAAVVLLWNYDIDIFKHIIDAFADAGGGEGADQAAVVGAQGAAESKSTFLGRIITGLLVAGGSGAVFNIFTKLNLRDPGKLAEKAQAARDEAAAKKAHEEAERRAREDAERQGGGSG
ncbi:MAG: hypothetical protein OXL68_14805 [Paracoccaceae bacterium]|nr:hypothetical protein [Paracoccaceae bacterium]